MRNLYITLFLFFLGHLFSFAQERMDFGPAIVCWTVSSGSIFNSGQGMAVMLQNTGNNAIYSSPAPQSKDGFLQVPPGKYVVSRIEVPVGNQLYINWSKRLADYFGTLNLEAGKTYYLGNFKGTFRGFVKSRRFTLVYNENRSDYDAISIEPYTDVFVLVRFGKERVRGSEVRERFQKEDSSRWEWRTLQKTM